ncbi:MAG: endonuclease domain-containing protein [Brevundimonas sp.]|nr:MAG: endonuclease domain-containing protein [Brevundimonas sp.]
MAEPITHERARRLRRPLSPPEARLWVRVRAHRLHGHKFRRQHPFGPYILDFYCAAAQLAVEVDGRIHDYPDRAERDRKRTRWLASQGVRVIRIAAIDVKDELDGVLAFIARVLRERLADPSVTSRRRDAPPPHYVER